MAGSADLLSTSLATSNTIPYSKLDSAAKDIRVLDIYPGDKHCQLRATLRNVNLNSGPRYGAISYVWGDPNDTEEILVDGKPFQATVSLVGILKVLRTTNATTTVWADAICINQSDVAERSAQVRIMNLIYRNATSVHIWLGEPPLDWIKEVEDEDFHEFPPIWIKEKIIQDELDQLGRSTVKLQTQPKLGDNDLERAKTIIERLAAGEPWFQMPFMQQGPSLLLKRLLRRNSLCAHQRLPRSNPEWYRGMGMLRWLLQRPYWSRAWCLQESFAPNCEPSVHAGECVISLHSLLKAVLFCASQSHRALDLRGNQAWVAWWCSSSHMTSGLPLSLLNTADLIVTRRIGEPPDFHLILVAIMGKKATDPRDKLYSILGIVWPEQNGPVDPDYCLSFGEVCCQTTKVYLNMSGTLDWIRATTGIMAIGIPSWAIDLSETWNKNSCAPVLDNAEAGGSRFKSSVGEHHELAGLYLTWRAIRIAAITNSSHISEQAPLATAEPAKLDMWFIRWLLHWQVFANEVGVGADSPAFWRTSFMDNCPMRRTNMDEPDYAPFQRAWPLLHKKLSDNQFSPGPPQGFSSVYRDIFGSIKPENAISWADFIGCFAYLKQRLESGSMFITTGGDLGIGRRTLLDCDEIYIFEGVTYPVILRKAETKNEEGVPCFRVVGECYLDGWMDGSYVKDHPDWNDVILI